MVGIHLLAKADLSAPGVTLLAFSMQVMTLNAQLAPSATKLHLSLSLER